MIMAIIAECHNHYSLNISKTIILKLAFSKRFGTVIEKKAI